MFPDFYHDMKLKFLPLFLVLLWSCAGTKKTTIQKADQLPSTISQLKFLDQYEIPFDYKYENTWVGGLSGIDYDRKSKQYYIISDERSVTSPSRFYTADIIISNNKIDTILFSGVYTMKMQNGSVFPSLKEGAQEAADPESIRINPKTNTLVWSSEGDRAMRNGVVNVKDPWVWEMDLKGNYLDSFVLPPNMNVRQTTGPRVNGVFEGLSFADDFKKLYVSVEEPLLEDGPGADVDYANAPIRIIKYDVATKRPLAQYAYWLDAVADKPEPANAFRVNGVSEILAIDSDRLLVMERSFSTGAGPCTIKIYEADLKGATEVSALPGLSKIRNQYKPASKKILLNMASLNTYIDNVEGITFGPKLSNGHYSLILTVDNNFNKPQKTQVFLFEVIP